MVMARRDLYFKDASNREAVEIEYALRRNQLGSNPEIHKVTVQEALSGKRVVQAPGERDVTRVLFISYNTDLLNPTTQSLDGYITLSDLFEEVHILILREGIKPRFPVLRVSRNVWIHTAAANTWWLTPKAGFDLVERELVFAGGFRPDLVVARDPFESAWLASKLGKRFGVPTQLHVTEDYSTGAFIKKDPRNYLRLFLPHFTIPRFASVRALTNPIFERVKKHFEVQDLKLLPRFQNYQALIGSTEHIDLKSKYRPIDFMMLYVGKLEYESTLYRALDAARFALTKPTVGMLVLGDGPARNEFQKRAKILEVETQVIFESKAKDSVSYLKSADILVVTDTDAASEEIVLKGAAAGIPMVMSRTDKREDIFVAGESAFLCDPEDVQEFTNRINDLINDAELRSRFITAGQQIIETKFHNDKEEYRHAYRTSIEETFFVEPENPKKE